MLKPGEVKESITVQDSAPLLIVDRADRGTVVENKFVQSIPLNLRNPLLLLTLTPGVTTGLNAGINIASQSTTNNFRINGGRGNTSELLTARLIQARTTIRRPPSRRSMPSRSSKPIPVLTARSSGALEEAW